MLYRATVGKAVQEMDEIYDSREEECPFYKDILNDDVPVEEWRWPELNSVAGSSSLNSQFLAFSALKMFGYSVGKTAGWPKTQRREFLSDFMEKELPASVSRHFGSEYGSPLSAHRLRKVANVISSNCSLRIRNDEARYSCAISDWTDDLNFLKDKYYYGKDLRFLPWPDPRA